MTNDQKIAKVASNFAEIMKTLGMNLKDPSLKETPKRVAKMYVNEIFAGLHLPTPKMTTFPNKGGDQMVLIKDITLYSCCEHHFVPFAGKAHIAYIPKNKKVLGLSKFSRVVQHFAAKPQVQESLTTEIAEFLSVTLKTENVAVLIDAKHLCCSMRGARDINSSTVTSHLGGTFRETEVRAEFFSLIKI